MKYKIGSMFSVHVGDLSFDDDERSLWVIIDVKDNTYTFCDILRDGEVLFDKYTENNIERYLEVGSMKELNVYE